MQYDLELTPSLWFERHLQLDPDFVRARLASFLQEDMPQGDLTGLSTIAADTRSEAEFVANQPLVFAGAQILSAAWTEQVELQLQVNDGEAVAAGTVLARVQGPAQELLARERVLLNLLQRLCGIASLTREYTQLDLPPGFRLLDTRKTTPGLRHFEKYAVAVGGGYNHRLDLSHVIMIKDNHLVAAGGIAPALDKARQAYPEKYIELEIDTLDQLSEALAHGGFDALLLDNMSPATLQTAVQQVREHPLAGMQVFLEASGGITYETLPAYAWSGVNGISVGALTTQARNLDIKLEFVA